MMMMMMMMIIIIIIKFKKKARSCSLDEHKQSIFLFSISWNVLRC